MKKATVVNSENANTKFRLIINLNETHSIGAIMTRSELMELMFEIKDLLEQPEETLSSVS